MTALKCNRSWASTGTRSAVKLARVLLTRPSTGILVGAIADAVIADPARHHPVAVYGTAVSALENRIYRQSRWSGALFTALSMTMVVAPTTLAYRLCPPPVKVILTAAGVWTALGGSMLITTAQRLGSQVEQGNIESARQLIPWLCGRDPYMLDQAGIVRATIESVAENTSDASVAPLMWAGIAGAPGVLCYRAINTLDSMVGYRNDRYRAFGWASAKLDDIANLVPARLSGVITMIVGGLHYGPRGSAGAWHAWRTDASAHPSPNAGVCEATFAGALGVRLGGVTHYRHGTEMRTTLGCGGPPQLADIKRTCQLSQHVQWGAVLVAVAISELRLAGTRRIRRNAS